jgi:hypothetical protein
VPIPAAQEELSEDDWAKLLYYGHADRRRAYELYTSYYLSTSGQIYWSDSHQRIAYLDGIGSSTCACAPATPARR